ncbi:four helix bundle protein [bacterium]|nr:four helix bundle protein [bacterium]
MEPARSFTDLIVWQKAHALVMDIYRITESFPKHKLYGLTSQIRRSSVSVPANIAEGFRRKGIADKKRFMNIAEGSLEETKCFLILARDLSYGDTTGLMNNLNEVSRILGSYSHAIGKSTS